MWPPGFHFLSIAFHLLDAVLVYVLLRKFYSSLPCLVGTMFFAVHGGHFRSIYWISAVPEPMALAFFLTSFLLFLRFDRQKNRSAFILSVAAMGLGMMCKESVLSLPLVLAAYCLFFSRKRIFWTLPHFLIAGAYTVLRVTSPAVRAAPYALTFGKGIWFNLQAYLSWAAGITDSFLKLTLKWEPARSYAGVAVAAVVVIALLLFLSRDKKVGLFLVVWFVVALQPVLYFAQHIDSYYLAPALPALSLLIASVLEPLKGFKDWKRGILALAIVLFIVSASTASVWKEGRWWNERTFIARTIVRQMPDVNRQVPSGRIAYLFGFGPWELGAMQEDAVLSAYGYPPTRFILLGLDSRTPEQIIHLKEYGGLEDYYCFLYSDGKLLNVTEEFRKDPDLFIAIQTPSQVELRVNSGQLTAGRDTLTLQISQLNARAIDVVYTLDGRELSRVKEWRLREDGSTSVFVDASTRKGLYHFVAIRDSNGPKGNWISVDARVCLK